jgi:hypothetical protein
MMAWNDLLYVVSYLSVPNAGSGTGLYAIDQNMKMTTLASHNSVYANRMLLPSMNSIIIGPYIIDATGGIRTFTSLLEVRVGGMAEHINKPTSVYMLGMDGPLWECDAVTTECTQLFDLVVALNIPATIEQPHFKAAHTMNGELHSPQLSCGPRRGENQAPRADARFSAACSIRRSPFPIHPLQARCTSPLTPSKRLTDSGYNMVDDWPRGTEI